MIPYGRHHIDEEDIQAVVDCLRSGILAQGPLIQEFERRIAEYVGVRYAVAVSSGTAALHLAMLSSGVGIGDEAITSPITFVATSNAVIYAGGRPVFADIDPGTINISVERLEEVLPAHPKAKVIVPVHFAGLACDMPAIHALARERGLRVVEDAAHGLGGSYATGEKIGSCRYSDMTIFSFHPVKSIATGEGGMVTTNDSALYRELLRLRSHGINKEDDSFVNREMSSSNGTANPWYYEMLELGYHYRITDIQCALGISQLKKLDAFIERRRHLAGRYDARLLGSPILRPAQDSGRDLSAHHLYPVRIDFSRTRMDRAGLMSRLREREIITQVHYIPVPAHPYYRSLGFDPDDYPEARAYYSEALSIPLYYDLTEAQQDTVIELIEGNL